MKKKLILVLVFLSFIQGCTKSCGRKEEELSINVDVGLPIESLDPRFATSAIASRVSGLVYAPLFVLNKNLSPEPFLAQKAESLDEKSFKITLKQNLTFHDGSPLTAKDVVYTIKELSSKDVSSPHAEKFNYIEDIKEIDDLTIVFELKEPYAPFLSDLCSGGIVSKKHCQNRTKECRHENIGSGPYKVKEWNMAKESLLLIPFDNWFEGAPKNKLLIRVVRDENTRMLELIKGKADIVDGDISAQNAVELAKEKNITVKQIPGLGYRYLALNVRGPLATDKVGSDEYNTRLALANKKVRKAISHAIDFDQIIEKVLLGSAQRVSGLIPNGHWAKDKDLKAPLFDQKLASSLLDEAGFKINGEKPRFKLTISVTQDRTAQNVTMLYVDYLQKVGIDAKIRVKDWSALYQDMKQGQFEMFSAVWVPVTEPDLYYWVHHSDSIPTDDKVGGNRHGYKNLYVDKLIMMGRKNVFQEQRKAIYNEIEKIMIDELPYIPLWNEDRIVILNNRVKEYEPMSTGSLLGLRNINRPKNMSAQSAAQANN